MAAVYIFRNQKRELTNSLSAHLRESLNSRFRMDQAQMRPEDVAECRWLGFGIGKGVANPDLSTTVFAYSEHMKSGLHGDLIAGFPDTDPSPLCYEQNAPRGFGGFCRWVYFTDPTGQHDILGIDWSIILSPRHGVVATVTQAIRVISLLIEHGLDPAIEVVLLNHRMCEEDVIRKMREAASLTHAAAWSQRANQFLVRGTFCPRCGLETFSDPTSRYCYRCGAHKETVLKGGSNV